MSYFSNVDDVSQFGRRYVRKEAVTIDDDGWFDRMYGSPEKVILDNDNDYTYHSTNQEEVDVILDDIKDSIRKYEEKKKTTPDKTLSQAFVGLVKSWCDDHDVTTISDEKMFEYYPDYENDIAEYQLDMIHYKYENYKYLEEKESFEINLLKTDLKNLIEKINLMEERRREMIREYNDDYDDITRRQSTFKIKSEPFGSTRDENILNLVDRKTSIHQSFADQLSLFDKRLSKLKKQQHDLEIEINETKTLVYDHNGSKSKRKERLINNLPALREFYTNLEKVEIVDSNELITFLSYDMNDLIYSELKKYPRLFADWKSCVDEDKQQKILNSIFSNTDEAGSIYFNNHFDKFVNSKKIILIPSILLLTRFKKKRFKLIRIQSDYSYDNFSHLSKVLYTDLINSKFKTMSYYNFLYIFELVNYLVGELKYKIKYRISFRNHDRSSSLSSEIIK